MRSVNCIQSAMRNSMRFANWNMFNDNATAEGKPFETKAFVENLNNIFAEQEPYGICNTLDFQEMSTMLANLLAFNNKRYYLYKAISNPNKIGYLSHRQYMLLKCKEALWQRNGVTARSRMEWRNDFLQAKGMMASPIKLFKEAFKDNPKARGLARIFHLESDGKTTANENLLIKICDHIMQTNTGMKIVEAEHVQECYDLDLYDDDYRASGSRFATSSCMYQHKVGEFYEAFGAKGMLVYKNGQPVGRFLKWTLPDGRTYIDRLYTKGSYANDALAEIDKQFPGAIKYPLHRFGCASGASDNHWRFYIPIADPKKLEKDVTIPYVDTFPYLVKKNGKLMLSNKSVSNTQDGVFYITTFNSTRDTRHIHCCPHCHQTWFGEGQSKSGHNLFCINYVPRNKSLQAMLKVFRDGMKKMEEKPDAERITFESVFQV